MAWDRAVAQTLILDGSWSVLSASHVKRQSSAEDCANRQPLMVERCWQILAKTSHSRKVAGRKQKSPMGWLIVSVIVNKLGKHPSQSLSTVLGLRLHGSSWMGEPDI